MSDLSRTVERIEKRRYPRAASNERSIYTQPHQRQSSFAHDLLVIVVAMLACIALPVFLKIFFM